MAYDVAGVQPMTGPTGLIFAMKSRYTSQSGEEALYHEAKTTHSGQPSSADELNQVSYEGRRGVDPFFMPSDDTDYTARQTEHEVLADNAVGSFGTDGGANLPVGRAMNTARAETLGASSGPQFKEMAFSIEKQSVTAKSRALKAEYTTELAQDLKAVHGLDAETELANILSTEILAEINREMIRTIYRVAKLGAQQDDLANGPSFGANTEMMVTGG